ncbi:MAG: Asp-tRNA(Asn)/Glu-tRNA(Gln) amidotransferase subunit GatC [Planctomycetota bacterium]
MEEAETTRVRKTAALARLSIGDDEAERLGRDFTRILAAFQRLQDAPLPADGAAAADDARAELRADEARPSLAPDAALANAPEREGDFYRVPKTVGGDR